MNRRVYALSPVLFAALLAACGTEAPPPAPTPKFVATLEAEQADGYAESRSYSGRVEAARSSALGFEVGGLLVEVLVEEGDVVREGDVIARLDTARLDASRDEAHAAVAQVAANLELAVSTHRRTEGAFEHRGISEQQLDEARQRVSALEAEQRVAEARVQRIDIDIDKSSLRAPFDGVVVRRSADPGIVLAAGQPIVDMQSARSPEVRVGVSPGAARTLAAGTSYPLTINGQRVQATLRAVVPQRDEVTRTVDAIFVVTDDASFVRPGDIAELVTETFIDAPGFWVPAAALVEGPRGLWQVLVAQSGGGDGYVLSGRTLEVLYADADRAYVRGTLANGERFVSGGTQRVVAGQTVRLDTSRVARAGEDN